MIASTTPIRVAGLKPVPHPTDLSTRGGPARPHARKAEGRPMYWATALLAAGLSTGAQPPARVAVVLEDTAPGAPARAAIEAQLQGLGFEVVAPDITQEMREILAPTALLGTRLPPGLS